MHLGSNVGETVIFCLTLYTVNREMSATVNIFFIKLLVSDMLVTQFFYIDDGVANIKN